MDIRSMARQGYSQRRISRICGISRVTVKKYLTTQGMPRYEAKERRSKLEPYYATIEAWLEQDEYQASRIYQMLKGVGYSGSERLVRKYVSPLKEKQRRLAYLRFETMPGQQAQVDFGDFQVEGADGSVKTVYCFIIVLGYSRHMYIEFMERCTLQAFLRAHQHAFAFFGGMPKEILYDNMKKVVLKRRGSEIIWNAEFAGFAGHYGFKPMLTPPYAPWVKGKVERPIHYLREGFWRGYNFSSLAQLNKDVLLWVQTTAFEREHGTTRCIVGNRFSQEQPQLLSLPEKYYDISLRAWRTVQRDCQVCFSANRYVVPHQYVGKKVLLKILEGVLSIYYDQTLLVSYPLSDGKGNVVAEPRFYQALRHEREQNQRKYRRYQGKAKATRGLSTGSLNIEVMRRPLSAYEEVISCV
ncbi:MAG: IS21 family transposase [Candidatus Omnitrophica bacterium]|nr:IS21 family transposase [Candidatus Omnitrophota bacterium]MCG2713202.1 IS21 family transposase [Candidatus Omnitrophota bacterium]